MPYKDPTVAKAKAREYSRRWRERHPEWKERRKALPSYQKSGEATLEARRAYWEVQKALRTGFLVRPTECTRCHETKFCEAAHLDYSKPLEVIWVCRSCHRAMDAANPNYGKETREQSLARIAASKRPPAFCPICQAPIDRPDRRTFCSYEHYREGWKQGYRPSTLRQDH